MDIRSIAFFALPAAAIFFVSGFLLRVPAAHAADCGITPGDIAQITAIQKDPSLSTSDEIKEELAVRKTLVGETIGCAEQEVETLQADLASTTVSSGSQLLQTQLASRLNEATEFYGSEVAKLNVVGIAGSEDIAQEVLAWRESSLLPLSENVDNFILWSQNQNLFSTAETRMGQTQRAVSFIESASPNPGLQSALDGAQASLSQAETENAQAETDLEENLSPDQPLTLIKESLDSLSSTYQGFFTVSNLINAILPQ